MRLTANEFEQLRLTRNLNVSVQAGKASKKLPSSPAKGKAAKYRNRKVYQYVSGMTSYEKDPRLGELVSVFDSEKEFRRYYELQLMVKQGIVEDLKRQVPILVQEACERNGEKIAAIWYKADFTYTKAGVSIVEDVKGYDETAKRYITTKDFCLKWKLLKYRYPDMVFRLY